MLSNALKEIVGYIEIMFFRRVGGEDETPIRKFIEESLARDLHPSLLEFPWLQKPVEDGFRLLLDKLITVK